MSSSTSKHIIKVEKGIFFTVIVYLVMVALFEILGYTFGVLYGSLGNAILIFVAINHSAWARDTALHRILPAMALIPLMRLFSMILPVSGWTPQIAYIVVSGPVIVAVGTIMRNNRISLAELGLRRASWKTQLFIALSGVPLGIVGYIILRPKALFEITGPVSWLVNLLIILVFIVFSDEIVFRGIFLQAVAEVNDNFAMLASALLYGFYHSGSGSIGYAVFMGFVGWLFSYLALRTRSLWGVIVAHFLLTVGMGLYLPGLL